MKLQYEKCMEARCFKEPLWKINERRIALGDKVEAMIASMDKKMILAKKDLEKSANRLDALSPLKTLERGYSITSKEGKVIKKAEELKKGDKVEIRFADGEIEAEIVV